MTPLTAEQQKLVIENRGMALAFVKKLVGRMPSLMSHADDLRSEAQFGLMHAAQTYGPERGEFGPWAYYYAKNYTYRYVRMHTGAVRRAIRKDGEHGFLPEQPIEWKGLDAAETSGPEAMESRVHLSQLDRCLKEYAALSDRHTADVDVWMDCLEVLGDGDLSSVKEKHGVSKQRLHQRKKRVDAFVKEWAGVS